MAPTEDETPAPRRRQLKSSLEIFQHKLAAEAWNASEQESAALREAFVNLTGELIAFVRKSIDMPPSYMRAGGKTVPKEDELQQDLYRSLAYHSYLPGQTRQEVPKVAAGRIDIEYTEGGESLTIECKRELKNAARDALQDDYARQGAAYSATRHNLAVVAVLDLARDSKSPPPVYTDCLWVNRQSAHDGGRVLLFVVLPGNLVTPNTLSR